MDYEEYNWWIRTAEKFCSVWIMKDIPDELEQLKSAVLYGLWREGSV